MPFNTTIDNIVYEASTQPENVTEKVFIQKEWNNPVFDQIQALNIIQIKSCLI